ncbi:MAG: site-specific DNA-methyltransferase, partial [Dehalococcoidia bacterium]|nr:site-specific DNA-methyltransferase [Dehalococcoidia bacterium]
MAESGQRQHVNTTRTELVWPGKSTQVERVALPFQVVETINQSRATREQTPMLAGLPAPPLFEGQSTADASWKNKLIWGENKYVMASLLQGDASIGLEPLAGKVNLIYIDPPFATGQDFSYRARVGDEEWLKEASIIEETAYRDTWGRGLDSYLQMMYERLVLMRELLAEDGTIFVHLGWDVSHHVKLILDEIFGADRCINQVVWKRQTAHSDIGQGARHMGRLHDVILLYAKRPVPSVWNMEYVSYDPEYLESFYRNVEARTGRRYQLGDLTAPGGASKGNPHFEFMGITRYWRFSKERMEQLLQEGRIVQAKQGSVPRLKRYLDEALGVPLQDIWTDILPIQSQAAERLGYDTQKPEPLLERIIKLSSNQGALVADFFCGSGTTMAVAEKLGRRWIGCDLSRYAIQVTRKRMLDIPDCTPFEVLNLGRYERKHWQVNVLNGRQEDGQRAITDYLRFIVSLYHAEPAGGCRHLHGQKAGRWVHVGASDSPVTRAEVMDAVRECQANRYTALDVLGWEWEMGLHDTVRDEARRMGVDLRLLFIPREVMDKRAVQAGDVHFYELAYLKAVLLQDGRTATVRLEDFIIPNPDLVPDDVRAKVKKWSDYI